jgi:hypothetical protein
MLKCEHNINNLLTESEGSTGKYPTEVLLYWPSDSEVNIYSKTEVGYFPVLPERLRSVRFLLYGIVRL